MIERLKRLPNRHHPSTLVSFGLIGLAAVLTGLLGASCQSTDPASTGGETHFLRVCDPDENSCGPDLSCICGACTIPCEESDVCAAFGDAQCLPASTTACGVASQTTACEVTCSADLDCESLSDNHVCKDQVCRNLSDGDSTSTTSTDMDTDSTTSTDVDSAGGSPMLGCSMGDVGASEVLLVGDSFFASSHEISADLVELARQDGVIETDEEYRDVSRLPNNALALDGEGIRDQYQGAVAESPARVVIMNGGGADILFGNCETLDSNCPLIANAANALEALMGLMEQDGVQQIIFVGYPNPEPTDLLAEMTLLRPLLQEKCAASVVPCHYLDLRAVFEGRYGEYILDDGINPTSAGAEATADAIWQLMQDECIAQ